MTLCCLNWLLWIFQVPLHRSIYAGLGLDSKIAFTCHNFEHQGVGTMDSLASCGIRFKDHIKKDHFKDNVVPDKINLLKVRDSNSQLFVSYTHEWV